MEHTIAHDATDEVPTDNIRKPPPRDDVTGPTCAETAMASPSRVGVIASARINATNQASADGAIATASPLDRNSRQ